MNYLLNIRKLTICFMLFFFIQAAGNSQDNVLRVGKNVQIVLIDGSVIKGLLVSEDLENYTIEVEGERVVIPKDKIRRSPLIDIYEGDDYRDFSDQYFAMPSALPVGKGNRYYRNIELFGNLFFYGVTDNFSINAGFETVSLFAGSVPGIIITPKLSIPLVDNVHFGIGSTSFIVQSDVGTTGFANITFGDESKNLTIGANFGIGDPDFLDDPLFSAGFMLPLNKKASLYGEVVFVNTFGDQDTYFDLLLRFKNKSGWAFDFGLASTLGGIDNGAIPLVVATIPF